MRKSLTATIVALLSLALAGVALAAFTQTSNITLTAHKAGASTGFKSNVYSSYPGGTKPKAAKQLVVTFPSGTKFNFAKFAACKLSDSQIMAGKACPTASQIGTGSAAAVAWPLGLKVNGSVTSYVSGSKSMIILVKTTTPVKQTLVIHVTVVGAKLTIPVPSPTVLGNQVILTGLKLSVPAKRSGKNVLAVAGKCTMGKFVIKSHFVYTDGSTFDATSSSSCS